MTGYFRQIHTSIWQDDWFLDLASDEKLLFIYLFSNEHASLSGLYRINLKSIAFETDIDINVVRDAIDKFQSAGKVFYDNNLMWIVKLRKYHQGGPTTETRIQRDIDAIPDCPLKRKYLAYFADGDTPSDETDTPPVVDDTPTIPLPYPIDTPTLKTKTKTDSKTYSEPKTIPTAQAPPSSSPAPPLSPIAQLFLNTWKVKRANSSQMAIIAEVERTYPAESIRAFIAWAHTEGMQFGHTVNIATKTLSTWGKPKPSPNGAKPRKDGLAPANLSEEERHKKYGDWGKP